MLHGIQAKLRRVQQTVTSIKNVQAVGRKQIEPQFQNWDTHIVLHGAQAQRNIGMYVRGVAIVVSQIWQIIVLVAITEVPLHVLLPVPDIGNAAPVDMSKVPQRRH